MTSYLGTAGGPRDPATPGGYCLAICRCGTCPQYPKQAVAAARLREREYRDRIRRDHERTHRRKGAAA